jgi:hypothetical protein
VTNIAFNRILVHHNIGSLSLVLFPGLTCFISLSFALNLQLDIFIRLRYSIKVFDPRQYPLVVDHTDVLSMLSLFVHLLPTPVCPQSSYTYVVQQESQGTPYRYL